MLAFYFNSQSFLVKRKKRRENLFAFFLWFRAVCIYLYDMRPNFKFETNYAKRNLRTIKVYKSRKKKSMNFVSFVITCQVKTPIIKPFFMLFNHLWQITLEFKISLSAFKSFLKTIRILSHR